MNRQSRSKANRSKVNKISASATLLIAVSISLANFAGAAPQKSAPVAKVAVHHSRISPPHAGVKLLEDILSRMRNLPQIAMSRNKQTFQYQQSPLGAPSPSAGTTDQLLAIRPPESSLKEKTRAKLKADRKTTLAMAEPMGKMSRSASIGSGLPSTNAGASIPNAYQISNSRGIQTFDTTEITNRLSPEARQRLTASSSKLFDVAKKLEEAQQLAQNVGRAQAGAGGSVYANAARNQPADERHSPGAAFRNEQKASKVISTNPLITEYDKASSASQFSSMGDEESAASEVAKPSEKVASIARPVPPASAAPMSQPFGGVAEGNMVAQKPPAEPSLFKHVREFLGRDNSILPMSSPKQSHADAFDKGKPIEIALLPPSVVTGIPLVRLGTSESETNKALAGKGQLNKTKVNDWSVWSLQKAGNDEVSLQIYSRNGQVEAIRIFDTSLISHDFGVKLGDDLATVKQKFGEPAFILSEPQSRGGQNYVYPISQVSFQLAYTSKTTAPKVVSLLIFNAK
ncbi:MAG: hypothetical protein DKT66_07280 [Candidatus Melainabacteria bacterium]|nr:MAG: hypothetical protein DKT66_07280 [Candidatus Melainabacteria bacterium]